MIILDYLSREFVAEINRTVFAEGARMSAIKISSQHGVFVWILFNSVREENSAQKG